MDKVQDTSHCTECDHTFLPGDSILDHYTLEHIGLIYELLARGERHEIEDIDRVEYWNFLKLDWELLYHKIDEGKPYSYYGYSPTGEMVNIMNGFGMDHVMVMYNKGMGNKEVMRLEP